MTEEEFNQLPMRCVCTLAMEQEHTMTFENRLHNIGYCVHTRRNKFKLPKDILK